MARKCAYCGEAIKAWQSQRWTDKKEPMHTHCYEKYFEEPKKLEEQKRLEKQKRLEEEFRRKQETQRKKEEEQRRNKLFAEINEKPFEVLESEYKEIDNLNLVGILCCLILAISGLFITIYGISIDQFGAIFIALGVLTLLSALLVWYFISVFCIMAKNLISIDKKLENKK